MSWASEKYWFEVWKWKEGFGITTFMKNSKCIGIILRNIGKMAKNALFSGFDPYNGFFWPNCLLKKMFKITIKFFWHIFFSHFVQILTYSVILAPKWRHFDDLFITWTIDEKIDPYNGFLAKLFLKKVVQITINFFCDHFFFTLCPNFDIKRHFGPKMTSFWWFVRNMESIWENWPL